MSEGEAFRRFVESRFGPRLSAEFRGKQWPIERIFYKWFRCELVHEGGLPVDIRFKEDATPDELRVALRSMSCSSRRAGSTNSSVGRKRERESSNRRRRS